MRPRFSRSNQRTVNKIGPTDYKFSTEGRLQANSLECPAFATEKSSIRALRTWPTRLSLAKSCAKVTFYHHQRGRFPPTIILHNLNRTDLGQKMCGEDEKQVLLLLLLYHEKKYMSKSWNSTVRTGQFSSIG